MSPPVLIAAGGTGGHMFPALALAAELQRRGRRVVLACDERGERYVAADIEHRRIEAASPSGGVARRLAGALALARGLAQAILLMRRLRPAAVATFGGYASVPVGLVARLLRIPLLVHEQNAVLGRANRLIARRAARLALTFPATRGAEAFAEARRLLTGNPVRSEVAALREQPYHAPAVGERLRVVVVGGSQGARILSEVLPPALAVLSAADRSRLDLTQQCRPEDLERVSSAYRALGFEAELATFFADLPARLAAAHLVISRAGASSVAEILALGRPALFVPFHLAADDHQRANAEAVADAGAGWVIGEAELTPEVLAAQLRVCLRQPDQLATMAARAHDLGRPDAASVLADAVQSLATLSTARLHLEALA